jgi:topoisomerase-4 subunit A
MAKIDHRLEVLEGFIIAFLNLDRVIDIIRYDDDAQGRADARGLEPRLHPRHVRGRLRHPAARAWAN